MVVIGTCALRAPQVPTLPLSPAQLGPSATAGISPTCPSVRSAPRDWPVLGVSEGQKGNLATCQTLSLGEEPAPCQGREPRKTDPGPQPLLSPQRAWSTSRGWDHEECSQVPGRRLGQGSLCAPFPGAGPQPMSLPLARGPEGLLLQASSGLCLQELGVQAGPPPPAQLATIALGAPNSQPSSSVPRAPGVTGPD